MMRRRSWLKGAPAAVDTFATSRKSGVLAAPAELKVLDGVSATTFDFDTRGLEGR